MITMEGEIMKNMIKQAVLESKLIAIVRGVEESKCIKIAQALYNGGFRLMEITYDQNKPETWESTAKTIGTVAKKFDGKLYVGAGTVTCTELVDLTYKYGGAFIISPNTDEEVIKRSRQLGVVSMPGALTPTEILNAHRWGADFVKLFPVDTLGPTYIKAIKAPLNHINLLAVGGVNEENVTSFLDSGCCGAGIGGNLVNKKWVEAEEFEKITETAKKLIETVNCRRM